MSDLSGINKAGNSIKIGASESAQLQNFSGLFKGEGISIKSSTTSLLDKIADLAEEISFVNKQGEEKNTSNATLKKHSVQNKQAIDVVNNYLLYQTKTLSLGIINAAKMEVLGKNKATVLQLKSIVTKYAQDDVSAQFMLLLYLEQYLEGNEHLSKALKKIRKELEEEHESEIYAGLNITEEVLNFVKGDKSKVSVVRKFYRQNVLGFESLSVVYKNILSEYGTQNFFESVDFMLAALGADLNSHKSSLNRIQLKPIMDDIHQLQELKTIYELSDKMVQFLKKYYNLDINISAYFVMDSFLPMIVDNTISIVTLDNFCESLGIHKNLEAKIVVANFLSNAIRTVPEKVFMSDSMRNSIINTISNYSALLYETEINA